MRWPGHLEQPGRTENGLVEGVDVLPTLLESAGIPAPGHLQGQSLMPALRANAWNGREHVLTEMHGWKTLRTQDHRYVLNRDGSEQLYYLPDDRQAYYDLNVDGAQEALCGQLRHQLLLHQLQSERPQPRVWPY